MEVKINFIFTVILIFTVIVSIYFVYELVKAFKDTKSLDKKYCKRCDIAYTKTFENEEYNYCPVCGEKLDTLNEEKPL